MKIAILSDIHGNQVALEAVLQDCKKKHCDLTVCLGDISNGGPRPVECLELVDAHCDYVIRGNHEHYSLGSHLPEDWETHPSWAPLQWTNSMIGGEGLSLIESLPDTARLILPNKERALFRHVFPDTFTGGVFPQSCPIELSSIFGNLKEDYAFVGHTHRASRHELDDITVINVGSVGMPFDSQHQARYVIVDCREGSPEISFESVPFSIAEFYKHVESSSYIAEGGLIARSFVAQVYFGGPLIGKLFEDADAYASEHQCTRDRALKSMPVPEFVVALEEHIQSIYRDSIRSGDNNYLIRPNN